MGTPTIEVIHGDSLAILPTLEAESFDAVITDPPFGIGFTFAGKKEPCSTPEEYGQFLLPVVADLLRVLRPGGFFACWQTPRYMRYLWEWFGPDIHIFCAARNFVRLPKIPITSAYDPIVIFYKPGAEPLRPQSPPRNLDFFVSPMSAIISDPTRLERQHPSPKHLDTARVLIRGFVLPRGRILDPFCGSGTTIVAAKECGRSAMGIEIERQYFEMTKRRLAGTIREYDPSQSPWFPHPVANQSGEQ